MQTFIRRNQLLVPEIQPPMKINFTSFFCLFILFCVMAEPVFSQEIKVLATVRQKTVLLRWSPTQFLLWQAGNRYGYVLERYTLNTDGSLQELPGKGKVLSSMPIKPIDEAGFARLEKTEPRAAIVSEMMYGKQFLPALSGDDPRAIMQKNNENQTRFGMALLTCDLSKPIAIAAGLLWIDRTVLPGNRYIYRVRIALPDSVKATKPLLYEPGVTVVDTREETKILPPQRLKAEFTDKQATLSWFTRLDKGTYTAYQIEKSTDGKAFKPVSQLPFVYLSEQDDPETAYFTDSLSNNEQVFYYRISGFTPFGDTGPPSQIVSGHGTSNLTGLLIIEKAIVIKNKTVSLSWSFPPALQKNIKGYFVSRSTKPDGLFKNINPTQLPPAQLAFTDEPQQINNYYVIRAVANDNTEMAHSFPYLVQLEDDVPPAVPTGFAGIADTSGIVRLNWKANTDPDLQGYRIFRTNDLKAEFTEITKIILTKTVFNDTINVETLTKNVFYKIISVDKHFNTSAYSPVLRMRRPDKIPPAPPVFIQAFFKADSVSLSWENSISTDVARYELYRQEINITRDTSNSQKITSWKGSLTKNNYKDGLIKQGKMYRYLLIASDSTGNVSKAISGDVFAESGVRKAVASLKAVPDREKRSILLTWQTPETQAVRTLIYRSTGTQPYLLYDTLSGNPQQFADSDIKAGNRYQYKIKVFFSGGVSTEMSKEVIVNY